MNIKALTNPLVSVIITTHNREDLLPRAVESVLAQTYNNLEIIIVDDGSTDNTEQLVNSYMQKHEQIKYIKHEKALGGNAARNSGIRAASGEFVAGLDDDDEFTPDRIQVLMNNYSEEYSMITSRSVKVTKTGKQKTKYISNVDLDTMLYFNAIGNQVLVKKEKIVGAGLFDENLKRYQDYDMWLRIIQKYGKAKIVNQITQVIHYEHDVTTNNTVKNNLHGAFSFYKKHKHLMNNNQRKMQLYNVYRLQQKQLSWNKIKIFFTLKTSKSIFKYLIIGRK
ncbi:MAG: glycosyltransferase [Arcobacter sp.]|nr:glycosyltransferase [Flavobacteriaceae bacterium]MBD3808000.1 glycosyltransferase [Campylobacterota bacterium]MBD3829843.1 glycosyltransferase [Arcobacter sp.]